MENNENSRHLRRQPRSSTCIDLEESTIGTQIWKPTVKNPQNKLLDPAILRTGRLKRTSRTTPKKAHPIKWSHPRKVNPSLGRSPRSFYNPRSPRFPPFDKSARRAPSPQGVNLRSPLVLVNPRECFPSRSRTRAPRFEWIRDFGESRSRSSKTGRIERSRHR